jgi:hypothetical protein
LIHEENNNRDDDEQAMLKAIQAVPSGKLEVGKIGAKFGCKGGFQVPALLSFQ